MAQFAGNLNTMLDEQPRAAEPARRRRAAGADRRRPARRRRRARPPRPPPPDSAARRRHAAADAPAAAEAPKVRKIDGPASRAGRARRRRRAGDPQAAAPRSSSACCCCCSSCAAAAEPTPARLAMRRGRRRAAVRALLGREPAGRVRGRRARRRRRPRRDPQRPVPRRRHADADALLAGRRRARCSPSAGSRRPAACGRPRPRSTRRPSPTPTPLRRRARRRRSRPARRSAPVRAASAARARASSACTPTTPGSSPAATTRSGAGSRAACARAPRRRGRARRRRRSRTPGDDLRDPGRPRRSCCAPTSSTPTRRRPMQLTNAIGLVADHLDDVLREVPGDVDASRRPRPRRRALAPRRRRARRGARRADACVIDRDAAEEVFRTLATESRADRLHNPGLEPARVDTVLAGLLRARRADAPAAARRASRSRRALMARHPSITAQVPAPMRLYGRRVMLRPLTPTDFAEWSEVRRRNEAWLMPWEPRRPPAALDPSLNRDAFQRPLRGTRPRRRGRASPTASACSSTPPVAGEVNLNNVVRGALQSGTIGYWIDRARAGHSYIAESVVVVCRVRVRGARPAPPRDLHRAAQPQQPPGDGEAGDPRGRHRPALPRDQRRVGGPRPLRHHRRGVARSAATSSSVDAWL